MKSMKLYAQVHRIHRELEALGIDDDAALRVDQLTPFDQYHYFGTDAVDEALDALQLAEGARVLDVGSGIGGPARYIAARTGAHVTALELQEDLHDVAADLTARCGLSSRVEHRCGDILNGVEPQSYDAIVSFLCFLHIPQRADLFAACRDALKPHGIMYAEDYARPRALSGAEADALRVKVQCPYVPTPREYETQLRSAGFPDVEMSDVTGSWREFTAARLQQFRASRHRQLNLHGHEIVDGLDDFYATVAGLFHVGAIAGVKIAARRN
jgi:cyclopropane fatty-acyl-phospholipid synthase-like methyltransferase